MEAMEVLITSGKVRAAGVCNYNLEELKTAYVCNFNPGDIKTSAGLTSLASNQVPYSMLKKDIEKDFVLW